MDKQYIVINLNKAESAETLQARIKERVRWGIFGVLIAYLMDDDEMVRGAWKGFLWAIVIYLIIWIIAIAALAGTVAVVA